MRASEREREQTIRVLHDGCAEGRLSATTLERRVERALSARTVAELHQLTADVPRVPGLKARLLAALPRRRGDPRTASLWLQGIGPRPFVVGRSRSADLVMAEETVSRRHAHIVRTAGGFTLVDLGSMNGTWLGGRRVGQVEVAAGDVVVLGEVPLRLL